MAKSIRSKVKRKARDLRRRNVYGPVEHERLLRIAGKLGTIPADQVPPEPPKRFSFTAPVDADHDERSKDLGLQSFRSEVRRAAQAAAEKEPTPEPAAEMTDDMAPASKSILRRKVASTKAVTGTVARKRKGSGRQLGF